MTEEQEAKLDLALAKLDEIYTFMTVTLKSDVSIAVWTQTLPLLATKYITAESGNQFITENGLYIIGE